MQTINKKGLTVKDLVMVGIFSTLFLVFALVGGTASYLVFFADPDGWAKTMLGNGTEQSYIDTMRSTGTTWILVIMLAGTILAAAISAFVGCRIPNGK